MAASPGGVKELAVYNTRLLENDRGSIEENVSY